MRLICLCKLVSEWTILENLFDCSGNGHLANISKRKYLLYVPERITRWLHHCSWSLGGVFISCDTTQIQIILKEAPLHSLRDQRRRPLSKSKQVMESDGSMLTSIWTPNWFTLRWQPYSIQTSCTSSRHKIAGLANPPAWQFHVTITIKPLLRSHIRHCTLSTVWRCLIFGLNLLMISTFPT